MSKMSAPWVLRLVKDNNVTACSCSETVLQHYYAKGDSFLHRTVTLDETLFHHY